MPFDISLPALFALLGLLLWGTLLIVEEYRGVKQERAEAIKAQAEKEYQAWKKERGL